ncbi:MerR family transcriptional regulator [Parafrankia colletiae]|uniref:MerR family transcriptional regulator n=1 Tax=Parafrankia colletiae TaxID=573497 RepID=A0A1S1QHJ7_9ACTN|nr:MerR family transcriptional regulator [Parafrankia colletiae]MCK9902884.1 MerR family transcriptional regulator [Frankia sp. Cpl3]OHV33069.1 MerR family transcriptional regulator [Parafrankia colletiae]
MRTGLTIGDFSRITHLSVKMLRRYHEAGLLEPAEVDPSSGYRYYTTAQVPTAQVIHRFRELGMPVREIGRILSTPDPEARALLVAEHLRRVELQLESTRSAVATLRRLLVPTGTPVEVDLRTRPPTRAVAIGATVVRDQVVAWYDEAMTELDATLAAAGLEPSGPHGGLYDDTLFTDGHGHALVYIPVHVPASAGGRVRTVTLPAAELAVTVHHGPHDDIDVTYGVLGTYIAEQAITVSGPVHEIYVVGPRDTPDASAWRTEIGWPVFRTWAGQPSASGAAREADPVGPSEGWPRPSARG